MSVIWCTEYIYLLGRLDWRGSRKWQPIGSGPCEVGADRQTVRGGEGVYSYNSGAEGITVSCWMVVSSLYVFYISIYTLHIISLTFFIHLPMKMELIRSSETSAIKTQTPGNYPKRNILQLTIQFSQSVRYMSKYQNGVYCLGVKVFNVLPPYIQTESDNPKKFKVASQTFLHKNYF